MYRFNSQTIGTCSICGGSVTVPVVWWGVVPPTPSCVECGANPRPKYGPVIDMQPARTSDTILINSNNTDNQASDNIRFWPRRSRSRL